MTWKIALQHLFLHWRLNLVLQIIMILGASLLSSLPMLAATIAGESLAQSLQSAPVHVRNIIVQGKSKTDELPREIEWSLGDLLKETIAVREGDIVGFPIISKSVGDDINLYPATLILNLKSFDHLEKRVGVLEGRLPEMGSTSGNVSVFEAVIGTEAARRLGLGLGDEVAPAGGSYQLRIVGIVEPLNPDAELWWGDSQMTPFSAWRRIHISPDIDEWNVSLLVTPQTMTSRIYHNQYWRIILNKDAITASNAPAVSETLINLQSSLSEDGMVVRTGLINLISMFEGALALAQVSLLLLTCQSLLAVFYLLGMFGSFLVEQSQMELATLSGRGFSRAQITGLFARTSILLALIAGSSSPWVARWSLGMWADWNGIPAPDFVPVESWWLALVTGFFSWITLVISVYRATRRDLFSGQGRRFEDRALTLWHPIWDIFILTLGGLAYWQLVQGSTITREMKELSESSVTGISDLVLLLGPTLLLLAAGLILIRLLPLFWNFFSWVSRQTRGLLWTLEFSRLARQPLGPSQVTLLISLTAGLTFFASAFTTSISNWQQDMALYIVGADIRLSKSLLEPIGAATPIDSPGIIGMTEVIRAESTFLVDEYQRLDFDLLAVDLETFPLVVSFPPGISSYSIIQILSVLELESDSPNLLPVVISSNVHTRHLDIGDQITLEMGSETYPSEVVGIIVNFPLVDDIFAIADLSQFAQLADLETLALTDQLSREIWMDVDPDEHEAVIAKLVDAGLGDSIAGNSQAQLEIFQNNLVFREVTTAFELNALVLIPLSVMGFGLIQLFSAQRRGAEFNILQAMGFSKPQLRGLLLLEGFIFVALGLFVGVGIGFGLVTLMQPFLAQILPSLGRGFILNQMLIDWPEMGLRFVALIGFYGIGVLVLMVSAFRNFKSTIF